MTALNCSLERFTYCRLSVFAQHMQCLQTFVVLIVCSSCFCAQAAVTTLLHSLEVDATVFDDLEDTSNRHGAGSDEEPGNDVENEPHDHGAQEFGEVDFDEGAGISFGDH